MTDADIKRLFPEFLKDKRWIELDLDRTDVSDESIGLIVTLPQLINLRVAETHVTEEGILAAAAEPRIKLLGVDPIQISPEQRNEIRRRRPDLEMYVYFKDKTTRHNLEIVASNPNEDPYVRRSAQKSIDEGFYLK